MQLRLLSSLVLLAGATQAATITFYADTQCQSSIQSDGVKVGSCISPLYGASSFKITGGQNGEQYQGTAFTGAGCPSGSGNGFTVNNGECLARSP